MNKRKILYQSCVCLLILFIVFFAQKSDNDKVSKGYTKIRTVMSSNLTMENVKSCGKKLSNSIVHGSEKVVTTMEKLSEETKYGEPIDEISDSEIKTVHAVAGGKVICSGRSENLGLYVKIKHENAISIYGNLQDLSVMVQDRVQRGEIIGTYNESEGKQFYFQLDENV